MYADGESRRGGGGVKPFYWLMLTNELRLYMSYCYNSWTIFSLNIIRFNGILYYSKRVAKSFIGWSQPMKWDVFVRDDVTTQSRSRRFGGQGSSLSS